ncbi:probable disease resistance protein At1g62630 isoform X1 [Zingiber officinale]|uniref:probable disease resistance protein At1g62630 isoform X1 n=1 Tax=Zingiber officinale TaxID=94328 RepID=UPI001C4AC76C|nr:probable disease resistance protein At1g62630 isoform X1 [Zingiber officinale]
MLLKLINNHEEISKLKFEHVVWIVASKECKLQKLQMDVAKKYAGKDVINSEQGINQLAREIAKVCSGVPLILITVRRVMSAKRSWRSDALMQLRQSRMLEVTDMKERDPMFAAFLLSYDSLEDDNMRAPLLCGSLWPEGFKIHKVELIQRWIGLGLINEFNSINKEFHRELSHIETLTFTCLLELVDSEHTVGIKMHDLIRDMVLWMVSDYGSNQYKWIVKAHAGLNQLELENEE